MSNGHGFGGWGGKGGGGKGRGRGMGCGCGGGGGKGRGMGRDSGMSSLANAFLDSPAVDLARLFRSLVGKVLGSDISRAKESGQTSRLARKALSEPCREREIAAFGSNRTVVVIDRELCSACGVCLEICAQHALRLEGTVAVVNPARCSGCGVCIEPCPNRAISPVSGKQSLAIRSAPQRGV